jgi:hypothetical protein
MASTIQITNPRANGRIPRIATVTVSYTNDTKQNGTVAVSCPGATASPATQNAPDGTGNLTFTLTHSADASGHTITATLTLVGGVVSSDVTNVAIGPIVEPG